MRIKIDGSATSPLRRWARGIAYSLWIAAGAFFIGSPSAIVKDSVLGYVTYAWAFSMVIGGGFALIGAITDRWLGEFTGLPMVIGTLWFYGGLVIADQPFTGIKAGLGLLLISFGFKVLGRFLDVWKTIKDLREFSEIRARKSVG